MNYDKLIEKLYKKACGKEIDKVSLKIYSNMLSRGSSVEEVYKKMQSKLSESPISTIKYFFEKYHGIELTEKEKSLFLSDYLKNGLLKCLKNVKEHKPSKTKKDNLVKEPKLPSSVKSNISILYCALIRDNENILVEWINRIKQIKILRPQWNINLSCYENDSVDKTKEILKTLDYSFLSWYKITSENTGKKPLFNKERERVKNLAAYRNLCVRQYADLDSIDRIIMHDVDCLYEPEDAVKLIEESLNWDVLSTISYPTEISNIVYDSWATRKNKSDKHWNHKDVISPGINRVYSTGNGFVCYNPEPFKKGMGFGYLINDSHDCENVVICENYLNMGYDKIAFHADYKTRHIILPRNKIKASGFFKTQEAREEKSIWASKKCCVDFLKQRNENIIIELSHCSDINSIKVFECLGDKLKPLTYKIEKIYNDSFTINIPLSNTKKICIDSPRIIPPIKKKGYNLIFKINSFQIGKEPLDINVLSDSY